MNEPKIKTNTPYTADEIFTLLGGMLAIPFSDSNVASVTDVETYDQYDFIEIDGRYYLRMINGELIDTAEKDTTQ